MGWLDENHWSWDKGGFEMVSCRVPWAVKSG